MPELPEVETVVRDLRPLVVGRTIRAVRPGAKKLRTAWQPAWNAAVAGCRIEGIRRRGKWIVVELSSPFPLAGEGSERSERVRGGSGKNPSPGSLREPPSPARGEGKNAGRVAAKPRLVVHLGMTGQFTAVSAAEPEPNHLHLVFDLDGATQLRFRDPRRFGSVALHPDEAAVDSFFQKAGLGPEPFGLDADYFRAVVRKSSRCLKAILLNQRVVAGVGNIYADEACFLAGLHPRRRGSSLTHADADRLRGAIETVLTKAIARRGSTIRDYVGGAGQRGGFQAEFRVYGRTGDPCGACGAAIRCVRLAGRSSHFCPSCQQSSPRRTQRARRKTG